MNITKNQMMSAIGIKRWRRISTLIPMKACKRVEIIYLFMYKNRVGFHLMMDLFIAFGVDAIFDLVENKTITNIWQLLRVMKIMKQTVPEYVTETKEEQPFVSLSTMKALNDLFHDYKFNKKQQDSFYAYLMENYIGVIGKEKIVLNNHWINEIMASWIKQNQKKPTTSPE